MYFFNRDFYQKHMLHCNLCEDETAPYTVGALLYSPATNSGIAQAILESKIPSPYSLALCLEDAISSSAVTSAEQNIISVFFKLFHALRHGSIYKEQLPQIFIRVRSPHQIGELYQRLAESRPLLTGFIAPKYSLDCCDAYNAEIRSLNRSAEQKVYLMPIIETEDLFCLSQRANLLGELKQKVDDLKPYILGVRVGGNDFCKYYGLRRHVSETIYEISIIERILSDILATFAHDYVVSGPVWEYFSGRDDQWAKGLTRELRQDRLNGFIGKTVIHPNQIPFVNASLCVNYSDFQDACRILNFTNDKELVEKSIDGSRMNEVKTHLPWAKKMMLLASIYGVKQNAEIYPARRTRTHCQA